jgi:hypothetical protein
MAYETLSLRAILDLTVDKTGEKLKIYDFCSIYKLDAEITFEFLKLKDTDLILEAYKDYVLNPLTAPPYTGRKEHIEDVFTWVKEKRDEGYDVNFTFYEDTSGFGGFCSFMTEAGEVIRKA